MLYRVLRCVCGMCGSTGLPGNPVIRAIRRADAVGLAVGVCTICAPTLSGIGRSSVFTRSPLQTRDYGRGLMGSKWRPVPSAIGHSAKQARQAPRRSLMASAGDCLASDIGRGGDVSSARHVSLTAKLLETRGDAARIGGPRRTDSRERPPLAAYWQLENTQSGREREA